MTRQQIEDMRATWKEADEDGFDREIRLCDHALALEDRLKRAEEVLEFYADPGTYFAIGFFPDRPCGDFMEDFDETEFGMKPGKMAREVLKGLGKEVKP